MVIAIISILAGMLLPALKSARDSAKGAVCKSNLRQNGTAFFMYLNEYNDYYPPCRGYGPDPPQYFFQSYLPGSTYTTASAKEAGVFWCPEDSYRVKKGMPARSYATNHYAGGYYIYKVEWPWYRWTWRYTHCTHPSMVLYFTDGYRESGSDVTVTGAQWPFVLTAGHSSSDSYVDLRHGNRANVLYLDGHVASRSDVDLYEAINADIDCINAGYW